MNREDLELHIQQGLSVQEIADLLQTSYSTVRYYVKKYLLTPNPHVKHHHCSCGETDSKKFYGKAKKICKTCFNKKSLRRWKDQKEKAVEYKGGKCVYCGYDKCISALEFHHRDPKEKEFAWDAMRKQTWAKVVHELDKCELVCANCHREVHETWRKQPASSSIG